MTTHYVYEFLAADGSHVYIGCTGTFAQRMSHHHAKHWWCEVVRIVADAYPDQASALAAEKERIARHSPKHNTVFTDRHDAGGWTRRRERMAAAHAAGEFCGDATCGDCIRRAHARRVTCRNFGNGCAVCQGFKPWWSLMTAEERAAHRDWEPLWEAFLDYEPTWAESSAWFEAQEAATARGDGVGAEAAS